MNSIYNDIFNFFLDFINIFIFSTSIYRIFLKSQFITLYK